MESDPVPVAGDGAFHRLSEVLPQVPAVGDLHRLRRALGSALGVDARGPGRGTRPHAGVVVQPGAQPCRGAFGKHLDRPTGLDIDQQSPVDMPFGQDEVIHAQNAGA